LIEKWALLAGPLSHHKIKQLLKTFFVLLKEKIEMEQKSVEIPCVQTIDLNRKVLKT
jgi:hypothetical protein